MARVSPATPATVSGAADTDVTATLTGLTPQTLYHVRARAVNSVGETQGDDQTFTTAGSPMEVWKFAHFGAAWTSVDMSDFLATPALVGSEYRLMAQTDTRLDKCTRLSAA